MQTIKFICPNCKKVNKLPLKDSYLKANCGNCKTSLLNGGVISAGDSDFYNLISNSSIAIVDFWAPWCGPCRMMAPNFEEASKIMAPKVQFIKVNTEEAPAVSSQFAIRSIPTLIVFKDGVEVERVSGALPTQNIVSLVNKYL